MSKSITQLLIGDLDEKRAYNQLTKRINALPKDYRFAFKKIQHYIYLFAAADCGISIFADLVDLFEISAAEGKQVTDIIGSDAAEFCDELIHASAAGDMSSREKLNKEIKEHFHKEEK